MVKVDLGTDIMAAVQEYTADPNVEYAEPNYIARITLIPNDTYYASKQWAPNKIKAPDAWEKETGDPSVIIAIIDTGIDFDHADLAGQIWTNLIELSGTPTVDDDGNGYIDDINGGDFVNVDNDPDDDHSHGSHVSGIAAATMNNNEGIAGICPGCRIMPLKVCDAGGSCKSGDIAAAIRYAADNGAKIISMGLGGPCSTLKAQAMHYAWSNGLLIIAAAGNRGGYGIDWPARFLRVMAIGASNNKDKRASFSDYGKQLDLVAPGVNILSTVPYHNLDPRLDPLDNQYDWFSGTSIATPHVAGVAGLIWSANPALSKGQVWRILIKSTDNLGPSG